MTFTTYTPSRSLGVRPSAMALLPALLGACNALDDPNAEQEGFRVVPTDERPAIFSETPPPALNGGTLLVTRDGAFAIAADEARDRLSVVDLAAQRWLGDITFAKGAEPGRLAEDDDGSVYVVLRRTGSIAAVSLGSRSLIAEYPVCAAPRGIAFDAQARALHVACASGRFVTLSAAGEVLRDVRLPNDLRDVVVENGNVWVSRFRSAEVLRIDASGAVADRLAPPTLVRSRLDAEFTNIQAPFEPNTAWRMTANPAGGVAIVHQRSTTEDITLEPSDSGSSSYGSAGGLCNGIQRASVTTFQANGRVVSGPDVSARLPMDMIMLDGGRAAVLGAGATDRGAPTSTFVSLGPGVSFGGSAPIRDGFAGGMPVAVLDVDAGTECFGENLPIQAPDVGAGQYVVAVAALEGQDRYLLQMRDPAQLVIISNEAPSTIPLGGDSVADTGFDLFHRDAEAGISCAACHPGGTDDGHVWRFEGHGPRRTQPIDFGLDGTAPFHWDGTLPDVNELMSQVFVDRMGGVHQSPERREALERWLFSLTPPASEPPSDPDRVLRGRRVFDSFEVGCADCHRGDRLTDNNSYDVATGEPGEKFQVPSLIGLGTRSRLIHDGCATTIAERFGRACGGGDRHGRVSQLEPEALEDLIAYLETL